MNYVIRRQRRLTSRNCVIQLNNDSTRKCVMNGIISLLHVWRFFADLKTYTSIFSFKQSYLEQSDSLLKIDLFPARQFTKCILVHLENFLETRINRFCIQLQSTLALRTPRYYGPPLLRTKSSPPPAEAIEVWLKMTPAIADSRYYGLQTKSRGCPLYLYYISNTAQSNQNVRARKSTHTSRVTIVTWHKNKIKAFATCSRRSVFSHSFISFFVSRPKILWTTRSLGYQYTTMTLSGLQWSVLKPKPKPKPKQLQWPITTNFNNKPNQWDLEAKTRDRRQARENACDQVAIDFGFTSDWLRRWREFF